jgi:ABC-type transporter Mla subunit MlaD
LLENVRDFGDRLRQHGLDPDQIITTLQAQLEQLERAEKELAEHDNTLLHSVADVAESTRNLVDGLEAVITQAAEERLFDPEVQEWQEEFEEMRKQYPKLD